MDDPRRPVLAIDPGRGKCGLAVVFASGEVVEQAVVRRDTFAASVAEWVERHRPGAVVIGNRTGSAGCRLELEPLVNVPIAVVEEHLTTLRAKERYFHENPPRGLRRFIPIGLQEPPRPIDDYAAVLLADEYWKSR